MKIIKYLLFSLVAIAIILFIAVKVMSKSEPIGKQGAEADALAAEILEKLNKPAFDTISYLKWEFFRPGQKYVWNKKENIALIQWDNHKVIMNLSNQTAKCYTDSQLVTGDDHHKLKEKAWSNWCNDSFWLIAPFKLFDPGTIREIVNLDDGATGIKITYINGGVTPGDSYVWILGKDMIPTGWEMWTEIIPVKGIYSAWTNWQPHMGALFSTGHTLIGKEVSIKGLKAGNSWQELGFDSDPMSI